MNVKDPRKKNYTTYETDVILLERILAYIFGVSSMNEITERFNKEEALANFGVNTLFTLLKFSAIL